MNNHRKYKKKKLNLTAFSSKEFIQDEEQQATQNLFNISNCWEQGKKEAHPEADIFNSVHSEEIYPQQKNKTPVKDNFFRLSSNKFNKNPAKDIQKIMDKQFIRESKNLLQLYSTPETQKNQGLLRQSASISSKKQTFIISKNQSFIKNDQKLGPQNGKFNILCNSFKSDSVFVVKRKVVHQKTEIQKSKSRLEELKSSREKAQLQRNHQIFMNTQKSGYFSPNRTSFHDKTKKTLQHKSLSEQKSKALDFERIDDFVTLTSMKRSLLKNSLQNDRQNIRLTADNHLTGFTLATYAFHTLKKRVEQKQKNSSFRRRFTFYKDQKSKGNKKLTV